MAVALTQAQGKRVGVGLAILIVGGVAGLVLYLQLRKPGGTDVIVINPEPAAPSLGSAVVPAAPAAVAPPVEATRADGGMVKLSDYHGKYLLLCFVTDYETKQQPDAAQLVRMAATLRDRAGGEDRLGALAIMLPQQGGKASYSPAQITGWTTATVQDWRQNLDPAYTNAPRAYLIDPEGKLLGHASPSGNSAYALLEKHLGRLRKHASGVKVTFEKLRGAAASPAFAFNSIPTISKDDAGQNATFSIVDGRKAGFGGGVRTLNDGLGPRFETDQGLMFTFEPEAVEGRLKADLGAPINISQINSYAWFKDSHRWAQVYRAYGSDGSATNFNPEPKIGTDPAACGWSFIAEVDTRDRPGGTDLKNDDRGQSGVSIHGDGGAIGKYRYLLFVTFATEMRDIWGQTFWSEIDIIEQHDK